MARIVIIGAGLTGISASYHLEKKSFFDYRMFEKEVQLGGLCRSVLQDGFTFDYTGHLLHANNPYFYALLKTILGLEALNTIQRRSYVYSHGQYTPYPFQLNLHGLPPRTIVECITTFINRPHIHNPKTFRDWVLTTFGTGFGKQFFFPYQQKIFSHKITHLTAKWTQRFVPDTSLEQILFGAISDCSRKQEIGYNAQFFYPKQGGIATWIHHLAQQILNPIQTQYTVKSVDINKKLVTFANGHHEPYEILISTIPLDCLLGLIVEKSNTQFKQARPHLQCNSIINFNIGVNHPHLSEKHWVYVPEQSYPFYRIGFWHNFSSHMVPPGCSSLYGEFAYKNRSRRWINHTLKRSLSLAKAMYNISPSDIATEKIITIPHAYVTYTAWREQNLPNLLQKLEDQNIYSVGRYGAWKYSSMQEAILDGKHVAHATIKRLERTPFTVNVPKQIQEESRHE